MIIFESIIKIFYLCNMNNKVQKLLLVDLSSSYPYIKNNFDNITD